MMLTRLRLALTLALVLAAAPVSAGLTVPVFSMDVTTYTCRELLALEEAQQNLAFTYFSGYVDGQRNAVRFEGKVKGEVIDKVVEHCRSHPTSPVLETFVRFTP